MSQLIVQNLNKCYGKNNVLDIEFLSLEKGESYAFFGANGSGKSTFLKCITGLVDYKGKIEVLGKDLRKDLTPLKDIGILIESPTFYKDMTGRENIRYFCSDLSRLEELCQILDMQNILDKKYRTYSLGMRQKLGILCACVKGKEIIVLDEPFNCLDVISVEKAVSAIKRCNQLGSTIVLTSHQLDISQDIIKNVYMMKNKTIHSMVMPQKMTGENYLFEFSENSDFNGVCDLLKSLSLDFVQSSNLFKIYTGGKMSFYEMIDLLKPYGFVKSQDITGSIKELYIKMEGEL